MTTLKSNYNEEIPSNTQLLSYFIQKMCILIISMSVSLLIFWNAQKPCMTLSDVSLLQSKMFPVLKVQPKPWYMHDGKIYPKPANFSKKLGRRDAKILPYEDPDSDRFENQLMFIPPDYYKTRNPNKNKTILFYNGSEGWWDIERDFKTWFSDRKCPVNTCKFSMNHSDYETAEFIMFTRQYSNINLKRTPNQVYAFYRLESPIHWPKKFSNSIIYNWTITYRHDSTIPIPYYKWVYFDPKITQKTQFRDFAQNKTKKAAWMVSNCKAENDRAEYVRDLQKYIQVDVYGVCGTMNCTSKGMDECLQELSKDYKFYLAFENSHCMDYITEKVYRNALEHEMVPVVLGARKEDYERQLPYNSFIYAEDFATPKELAEYLHKVDKDDDLYNSYFQWKGTGEMLNKFTHLWCRICALLHDKYTISTPHWYDDINKWWFDPKILRRGLWRSTNSSF